MTGSRRPRGRTRRWADGGRAERPTRRDHALAALTALFALGSVIAMIVTVASAERSTFVIVVEVATWLGATGAIVLILWRRTVWGRRSRDAGPASVRRSGTGRDPLERQ